MLDEHVMAADAARVSLAGALFFLPTCARLKPIYAQLRCQTSVRVELNCLLCCKKGKKAEFGLDVSFSYPLAWGQFSNAMDHELLRRMKTVEMFVKDNIRFHISTDKANVNSISLMNTLISCDGSAAVLPPQVVVVVIRKRKARDNSTHPHSAFCFLAEAPGV